MGQIINFNEIEPAQQNVAMRIIELEEELEAINLEIKDKREQMLVGMVQHGIKSIKTQYGTFIATERENVKVDKKTAIKWLDSQGLLQQFQKLDDTKVKKTYYDKDSNTVPPFIEIGEPTKYLTIRKDN